MPERLRIATVTLQTLSPLFIGSGEESDLSPYTDFIQEGGQLIYLDERKFQAFLSEKPELVDKYVSGIRDGFENNRSTFSLAGFLASIPDMKRDNIERRRIAIDGEIKKNQLRRFLSTSGLPYVPGSTIKGAIRTAVLFDWIMNSRAGRKQLQEIKVLTEKRFRRDLQKTAVERNCFGPISRDTFRFLRISDTETAPSSAICVSEIRHLSLYPSTIVNKNTRYRKAEIPQWNELLRSGATTTFSISLEQPRERTGFSFFDEQKLAELFTIINRFSRESCLRELDELEERPQEFNRIYSFYEQLESQLGSLGESEAIIRLGGGKTWFDNSIGLALDSEEFGEESLFGEYLNLLKIGRLPFPSTRSVTVSDGRPQLPLGWVKLSINQK